MQRTPGSETRSSRDNPPFSGWNAINHVRYPSSPDPTEHDHLAVQSPQSSPWKPSQTNPPIAPASDGIKRTGAWLESMAKRRKAAQATVKSASENWEPRSPVVASTRSIHSSMSEGSNGTWSLKARETRIIPGAAPKFRKSPLFIPPPPAKPRRHVQVVIPFRTHITLSPSPEPTIPQPIIEAAPFIQSPVLRSSPRFERLAHHHPRPQPNSSPIRDATIRSQPPWPTSTSPKRAASIHTRFDEDIITPFKTSPMTTPQNNPIFPPPSSSSSSTAPNHLKNHNSNPNPSSCDERLRRARRHEKKSNALSLLRHEFRSDMSYRHAEALIDQTRRSPERAFGFSLPCNSVLLSIEQDGD